MRKALAFMIGAAIGSVLTLYFSQEIEEEKNEKILTWGDIKKEREEKLGKKQEKTLDEKGIKALRDKPDIMSYSKVLNKEGYTNYADVKNVRVEKRYEAKELQPYVIDPNDFGNEDEYETISLTYYADAVLADDLDELVDAAETVGEDFASHFGEYEDDSVHIRNDKLKVDYEILKDERTYKEAMKGKPQDPEVS